MYTIEQSDNELIYMIRCGSNEAFDLLSNKYSAIIKKYITEFHSDIYIYGCDIEDAIEECFITFYEALFCFVEGKGSFYSYVINSVRFKIYDLIKISLSSRNLGFNYLTADLRYPCENSGFRNIENFSNLDEETHPINHFLLKETTNNLFGDNSILAKEEKTVLSLKVMGYSIEEIAQKLRINRKRVEYIIKGAKNKIKDFIK